MTEEVQKHSVHTLVFRSLKRSHDMFVADHAKQVTLGEESHKLKMAAKLRTEYGPVLHMPVLKEGKSKLAPNALDPFYLHSIYSSADNGTIHLWDWRTGYNFQRIHAAVQPGSLDSESGIFSCVFDRSESRLITAEADKTIKVYKEDDMATEDSHPVNWKPEILKRKRF